MIKNNIKQIWSEGGAAINGWLSIGNPFTAEIMAAQTYDSITIDMQHGALDYSSLLPMFQAMRASGKTLMARVPWNDPGIIMKALDAGAYSVISAFLFELVATFLFVTVILGATQKAGAGPIAGLAIGLTLVAIHLAGITVSGSSVNPARSFGPALFAGPEALSQLWLYIVAPCLGALAAGFIFRAGVTSSPATEAVTA